MPLLDVTRGFNDPNFTDTITVTRRSETVGNDGMAVIQEDVSQGITAIVTPGLGTKLQNLADMTRDEGFLTVHTEFRLSNGKPTGKADVVTWDCADYVVLNVKDFSRYGAGFVTAICQLESLFPAVES